MLKLKRRLAASRRSVEKNSIRSNERYGGLRFLASLQALGYGNTGSRQ
jgi:hypothetical protein